MNRTPLAVALVALAGVVVAGGAAAHRASTIKGTKGHDVLTVTPAADRIWALAGNAVVNALDGADRPAASPFRGVWRQARARMQRAWSIRGTSR